MPCLPKNARRMITILTTLLLAVTVNAASVERTPADDASIKLATEIFKQLIEINTSHSVGSTTIAAEAMAKRLRDAGFPAEAWRYALMAFLAEAHKRNVLRSSLSNEELLTMFATQYKRPWNVFVSRNGSKSYRLKHDGRYIRRPPIAQHRVTTIGTDEIEYLAKDTKNR